MRLIIIVLLSLIMISCTEKDKGKYDDLYEVIDEMLRFNNYDADIVILELKKVHKGNDTVAPMNVITYNKDFIISLYKDKLLDSTDIDFMYNQIDTLKDYTLDSTKIFKRTLNESVLISLFKKYGSYGTYDFLMDKFNARCFMRISTPIISKDRNKMMLDVETHCGPTTGGGLTYLLEKKNGKWRIIFCRGNWVS